MVQLPTIAIVDIVSSISVFHVYTVSSLDLSGVVWFTCTLGVNHYNSHAPAEGV